MPDGNDRRGSSPLFDPDDYDGPNGRVGTLIGLRHLKDFTDFFSQIGYFTDSSGPQNSPQSFASQLPLIQRKCIRVYMDAGLKDLNGPEILASTRQCRQTLDHLGIENVIHEFPGGQGFAGSDDGWNYDHKHAMDSLSYVGEQFQRAERDAP